MRAPVKIYTFINVLFFVADKIVNNGKKRFGIFCLTFSINKEGSVEKKVV